MRRSSTDESTYRRSPSPESKEPGFSSGGPFRRCSSLYGRAGAGDAGDAGGGFFGLHTNPGPKAAQARYTTPKGNKYVVFYLDLSFIFLLELKRCSMARGCLQGVKYLMFAFNLLFWVTYVLASPPHTLFLREIDPLGPGPQLDPKDPEDQCLGPGQELGSFWDPGLPRKKQPEPPPPPPDKSFVEKAGSLLLATSNRLSLGSDVQLYWAVGQPAFEVHTGLGGCGVLGVGIWLAATQGNFATLSSSFPSLSAANLLIVTGTFVMAIGFVGCIGALKENKCLLLTFFVLLLLVFLLEATIAVLFFAYSDKIDSYAQQDLKKGLHLYGTQGNVGLTNAWSIIQTD
ncbi:hypothetical protein STEG23_018958, partial [Scotinomys teguina]